MWHEKRKRAQTRTHNSYARKHSTKKSARLGVWRAAQGPSGRNRQHCNGFLEVSDRLLMLVLVGKHPAQIPIAPPRSVRPGKSAAERGICGPRPGRAHRLMRGAPQSHGAVCREAGVTGSHRQPSVQPAALSALRAKLPGAQHMLGWAHVRLPGPGERQISREARRAEIVARDDAGHRCGRGGTTT